MVIHIKKTFYHPKRDEKLVKKFIDTIKTIDQSKIIYIDEAGSEDNMTFNSGYILKGKRCYGIKEFRNKTIISKIAALRNNKLFAPLVFTGYCDGKIFGEYIRNFLLKELKQNDVVVMDNISFHKNKEIISIIEGTDTKILYIRHYCPDLNKIKHFWHKIKQIIRKTKHEFENFFDCVCHSLNMSIS